MEQPFSNLSFYLAKLIFKYKELWIKFSDFEYNFVKNNIQNKNIINPIYITGLARSGTTIMLEKLSMHKEFAYHSYRDFPMIFTPYFWNKTLIFLDRFIKDKNYYERSHKDGISINSNSPEAFEEVIWRLFFNGLANKDSPILDSGTDNYSFAQFYHKHILKLLHAKSAKRYLTKANYNISRIDYIKKLYPDSKFIIMIRNPVDHINSIIKQDKLFTKKHRNSNKTRDYMHLSGHFEFGLSKKLIKFDQDKSNKIESLFKKQNFARGWGVYWNIIYQYIYQKYKNDENVYFCRYETLCKNPESEISNIQKFCQIEENNKLLQLQIENIKINKKQINLTDSEINDIINETNHTAKLFNY